MWQFSISNIIQYNHIMTWIGGHLTGWLVADRHCLTHPDQSYLLVAVSASDLAIPMYSSHLSSYIQLSQNQTGIIITVIIFGGLSWHLSAHNAFLFVVHSSLSDSQVTIGEVLVVENLSLVYYVRTGWPDRILLYSNNCHFLHCFQVIRIGIFEANEAKTFETNLPEIAFEVPGISTKSSCKICKDAYYQILMTFYTLASLSSIMTIGIVLHSDKCHFLNGFQVIRIGSW